MKVDRKALAVRIVRAACLSVPLGMLVTLYFVPLLHGSTVELRLPLLGEPEYVGFAAGALFFFVALLTPLPDRRTNLFAVVRSIIAAALVGCVVFAAGQTIDTVHELNLLFIMTPPLSVGLVLCSWKNRRRTEAESE